MTPGLLRSLLPRAHILTLAVLLAAAACSESGPAEVPPDAGPPAPAPVARLETVSGEVTLERAGQRAKAQPGPLLPRDAVETGADGKAKVLLSGGRAVELGPDARFELKEGEGGLVLDLLRGLVLTRVEGGGSGVALTILTPFGLTRVGADPTALSVDVTADGAAVDVSLGSVEVVSRSGEVTKAGKGDKVALGQQGVRELELPPVGVVILQVTGRTELRARDGKAWKAVQGKKPTPVVEGDAVRVRSGRAVLAPDGSQSRLVLVGGAEATLGRAALREGAEETALELQKGGLEAALPYGQRTRLTLKGLTIVAARGGTVHVHKTAKGYQVQSLAGGLSLEREGQPAVEVEGGGTAVLEGDQASVQSSAREALALPSRAGLRVYQPQSTPFAATWDPDGVAEGKPLRVVVASDAALKSVVLQGELKQRFVNLPAPAKGALFWKVYDGDAEVAGGSARFAPEPKAAELDLNKNEVPEGTEKTTIFYQDKPPAVTFSWKPESGAAKYRVLVYRDGDLSTPLATREATAEKVALPDGALVEGNYLWSVTPIGPKGDELRGGKMNKLELVYDNAVPNLVIKTPRNGDPGGAAVRVSGVAPVGARVWVNNKPLQLDGSHRFDTQVAPLPRGLFVFRMQNGGADVYTVRRVKGR